MFCLPLLFLPNLGFGAKTAFGTVELSDLVILPYIALVLLAIRKQHRRILVQGTEPLMVAFLVWAAIATLSIPARYGYQTDYEVYFAVLKLAKLALYSVAGVLTAKALARETTRYYFHWALLAAGCVVGGAYLLKPMPEANQFIPYEIGQALDAYKANNVISALMAILGCYIAGLWMSGYGRVKWRQAAAVTLLILTAGSMYTSGRTGWVAGLIGCGYVLWRVGVRSRVLIAAAALVVVILAGYWCVPDFQSEVDKTIRPTDEYLNFMDSVQASEPGFNDGVRLHTWAHEAPKILDSPLLGTGFYHRGGATSLWTTGSHNFWIQMFLETGIVGGVLVLIIVFRMWQQAGSALARAARMEVPLKAAILAALVANMGGEYCYGGMTLLTLFLVYAPVASMPQIQAARRVLPIFRREPARSFTDAPSPQWIR
jgi:O-antigen ligase